MTTTQTKILLTNRTFIDWKLNFDKFWVWNVRKAWKIMFFYREDWKQWDDSKKMSVCLSACGCNESTHSEGSCVSTNLSAILENRILDCDFLLTFCEDLIFFVKLFKQKTFDIKNEIQIERRKWIRQFKNFFFFA